MVDLPYLASYKNIWTLFDRILAAKQPDDTGFTHGFLTGTLGLKSTTDRPLIPLLRMLGFIDAARKPTPDYAFLKNRARRGAVIAAAMRRAYAPLFAADENAHQLGPNELRGLVAQVAGTDEETTEKIAATFRALASVAKFVEPA